LDGDPTDAVVGVSHSDRGGMAEMEKLIQSHHTIPFSLMRESSQFYRWFYNEQKFLANDQDRAIIEGFYNRFAGFMVPVVALSADTGKDNIVNIFERINRTGVSLSLFDLAVARLYLKGVYLRDLWSDFVRQNDDVAKIVKPEFLLKVIALLEGRETKRGTLLDVIDELDADQFKRRWITATEFVIKSIQTSYRPERRLWCICNKLDSLLNAHCASSSSAL
jgi:hypothetical protein